MLFKLWCWRRFLRVLWTARRSNQLTFSFRKSTLNIHWKGWCWIWSSSILVIWCEQMTHWKSPSCWERLRAEGEEGIRGWDGWTVSPMQWIWTWKLREMLRDREAWHAAVHGVEKNWTWLHDWTTIWESFVSIYMKKPLWNPQVKAWALHLFSDLGSTSYQFSDLRKLI